MRNAHRFTIAGLSTLLVLCGTAGCYDVFSDATLFRQQGGDVVGTGGAGGGTTSTTIDPGCHPSKTPNPVRDDCGIFVSSSKGSDANDGSMATPYATIGAALASPAGGPIYLCAETFGESVHIKGGRTLYGGLDCTNGWAWSDTAKSEISPGAGEVPLVVDPQVGVVIEDVALRAKDATEAGGSSIAVIVTSGADVSFARCEVEAGTAKEGAPGEAFLVDASAGMMGNVGADACTAANVNGGANVQNACDDADPNDDSIGGLGGAGTEFSGGAGSPGTPLGAMNAGNGQLDDNGTCTAGGVGDDGGPGSSAKGALGPGSISPQGYAGTPGNAGDKGKPGQGGGGGGGAKGGTGANKCAAGGTTNGGASGGSGGSGACGGSGGKGGQAGGASIGIVAIDAKLTFAEKMTVTAKNGGNGGAGGDGQLGGNGGAGGPGGTKAGFSNLKDGCKGGSGGSGGPGGKGGGGLGGPSIGIAFTGDAPVTKGMTFTIGAPGDGGAGDGAMGAGEKGVAAETQAF